MWEKKKNRAMKVYQYCNKCRKETDQEITGIRGETVSYICISGSHEGSYVPPKRIVKKEKEIDLIRLG